MEIVTRLKPTEFEILDIIKPGGVTYSVTSDHKEMLGEVIKFREKLEKIGKLMFVKQICFLLISITLFSYFINYNFFPGTYTVHDKHIFFIP